MSNACYSAAGSHAQLCCTKLLQEYSGSWVVEPDPSAHTTTLLKYEISLQPKLSIPSAIVTCVVKAGLPTNMQAMAKRAEQVRLHHASLCSLYSLHAFVVHCLCACGVPCFYMQMLYPVSISANCVCTAWM